MKALRRHLPVPPERNDETKKKTRQTEKKELKTTKRIE